MWKKIKKLIARWISQFHDSYFDSDLDIHIRTMHLLIITGIFAEFIIAIIDIIISLQTNEPIYTAIIDFAVFLFALLVLSFARRIQRYDLFKWVSIIGLFMIVYPIRFFYGGGYMAGMSIIFLLALFYSSYLLEGKTRIIVVSIQFTIYVACHIIAYDYPHLILANETRFKDFADMTLNFTVFGIVMLIASIQRSLMAERQNRRIEEYNTELILQNKTLEQYDRMKDDFLASVAHELNTPLAVIKASCGDTMDLIQSIKDFEYIEEHEAILDLYIKEIEGNSSTIDSKITLIKRILTDLMDKVAIEHGSVTLDLESTNLTEFIPFIVNTFFDKMESNGNIVKFKFEEDLPNIKIDHIRIEQVINNLLKNAVRHTFGGLITIRLTKKEKYVQLQVIDTGEGMDDDMIETAFMLYATTKEETWKHGIGLPLCQRIVHAHGGTIKIERGIASGVVVTIELPI